jgi:hypothetical protein
MTKGTSPADLPRRPLQPDRPPPRRAGHPRFRRVAFAPLWLACVLVLSLGIAAAAAYLITRRPDVVETVLPAPPPAELSPEVVRRAEALRALNGALADQIEALRRQIEQPPCPPGTAVEANGDLGKSSIDEAIHGSPDRARQAAP